MEVSDLEQGSSSEQIGPRYADRFAPPCLAALFALVVLLYLSRAGDTALLCTRLLFSLSSTVYVAALLLRQREERWICSSRAEAWRAATSYCRRNYVVIFLYGSALLVINGGADNRYVVVVSLLAPALSAISKVSSKSRFRGGRDEGGAAGRIHQLAQ